jgi:hypothetical protein
MRLVMTLLVRDEADIIDEQISFHLAAGVDFIVATDHGSTDGTTELLERYARENVLHLRRETDREKRQAEWVTRMARSAAVDHGADWVINSDADEFWWPRGGTLKEVLAAIPRQFGVVHTFVQSFLPRPGDGSFAERLTVRLASPSPIHDPRGTFRTSTRLLHRGAPDIVVGFGNASLRSERLRPLHTWSPVEVLHFPIRSFVQFERKFRTKHMTAGERMRSDTLRLLDAAGEGRLEERYGEICPDDASVQGGLEASTLVIDVRLRDALRALAGGATSLSFPRAASDEIAHAANRSVHEAGELVRLTRRADELHARVRALERSSRD